MSVKNKKNSSVNSLVRAELVTARPTARPTARLTARPPASGDHYTPQPLWLRGKKG